MPDKPTRAKFSALGRGLVHAMKSPWPLAAKSRSMADCALPDGQKKSRIARAAEQSRANDGPSNTPAPA
jgi:hypothetical protein